MRLPPQNAKRVGILLRARARIVGVYGTLVANPLLSLQYHNANPFGILPPLAPSYPPECHNYYPVRARGPPRGRYPGRTHGHPPGQWPHPRPPQGQGGAPCAPPAGGPGARGRCGPWPVASAISWTRTVARGRQQRHSMPETCRRHVCRNSFSHLRCYATASSSSFAGHIPGIRHIH
jgi:hypothetical protein